MIFSRVPEITITRPSRNQINSQGQTMPVFISHKSSDKPKALEIANYLTNRGVSSYIDVLDPLLQSADNITAVIVKRVRECTHLIAVTSTETTKSWWVPFEIGVATDQERRIATFALQPSDLPEYLKKWPIMTNAHHLEHFIALYNRDKTVVALSANNATRDISSADTFHASLKRNIGQY